LSSRCISHHRDRCGERGDIHLQALLLGVEVDTGSVEGDDIAGLVGHGAFTDGHVASSLPLGDSLRDLGRAGGHEGDEGEESNDRELHICGLDCDFLFFAKDSEASGLFFLSVIDFVPEEKKSDWNRREKNVDPATSR